MSSHRISIWLARRSALIHLFSLGSVRDIRRRQHVAPGLPPTNLTTTSGLAESPARVSVSLASGPYHRRTVRLLHRVPVPARFAADQLKKLVTAVASSGEADVARFW